jgi:hypothetical protein
MKDLKHTTDVWYAGFLLTKGIKLAKYDVIDRGKVRCYFELTDDQWKQFKVEFNNSEISDLKQAVAKIKDLAF